MFRLFQRLVTALAALGIFAAIFYLVSIFYDHVGQLTPKPKEGVVYVMTFKSSEPSKPPPSAGR